MVAESIKIAYNGSKIGVHSTFDTVFHKISNAIDEMCDRTCVTFSFMWPIYSCDVI